MTKNQIIKRIKEQGVIAAVKDEEGLEKALASKVQVIFVLFGDIMTISETVAKIRNAEKAAIVHLDLITGLGPKEVSVDFIKEKVHADGIISTRQALVKRAKDLKLFTVMRFFVLDSMALINLKHQYSIVEPDCVEILPGLMPKIISKISVDLPCPLIAGGLVSEGEDAEQALKAGAVAVSTTAAELW